MPIVLKLLGNNMEQELDIENILQLSRLHTERHALKKPLKIYSKSATLKKY